MHIDRTCLAPAGILAIALLVSACGASPVSSPQPRSTGVSVDDGRYFSIDEVGLGPNGWVTLGNFTDVPASLGALYLCQPPDCIDLPDVIVDPGAIARIAVGSGSGIEDVAMTDAELDLPPEDGEVALYSTDDVDDASRLWAYLEWGSTPHTGTRTAIEAGRWREGTYAPTSASAVRLWRTDDGLWVWE